MGTREEAVRICAECSTVRSDLKLSDESTPCSDCGAMGTRIEIVLEDTAGPFDLVGFKQRGPRGGKIKDIAKGKFGTDPARADGRPHRIERSFDHRADRYDELITDLVTGVVVREVHEPLSEHRGRGDDRGAGRSEGSSS